MSNHTHATIEDMLRDVREALQMDVAFVSKFDEDQLVFRKLEGDAESFGWQEGESFPIDESYCKRVLDGRIPRVVPDAKREDATKDLRVTLSCSPVLAYPLFQWGGEKRVPRPARRSFLRPR